ncbi:MAG: bifunctional hydroxymethylpyrimidine kinase/phosphomethylpyrimidine kinase [Tissierellia bacterium]|nr:bifunctional hydroxymethylpyrimidine kinase/phosphomethylpyrimidine kinase [Tissierellia bacterium]
MARFLPPVLSIAGSDSSGGAGIQADLKTMAALGVYGMTAITALTAQNTQGVSGVLEVPPEFLEAQLDSIFDDIPPRAIKIGMVSSIPLIEAIAGKLREYRAENIVVDPVMVATSGAKLLSDEAVFTLKGSLFPLARLITPNIPEGEILSGREIRSPEDMEAAAKIMGEQYQVAVLLKGGHQVNDANDLFYHRGRFRWFHGERIDNHNTHGTGCTLSSATSAHLALGFSLEEAIEGAKEYIEGALRADLNLGRGSGPLNHMWQYHRGDEYEKL